MTFRLSTLLIGVTAVAVLLFLLVAAPWKLAVPGLITLWLVQSTALLTGVIWARGRVRAFCIGGMVPAGGTLLAMVLLLFSFLLTGTNPSQLVDYLRDFLLPLRIWSVAGWLLVIATGSTAMICHRLFVPADETSHDGE